MQGRVHTGYDPFIFDWFASPPVRTPVYSRADRRIGTLLPDERSCIVAIKRYMRKTPVLAEQMSTSFQVINADGIIRRGKAHDFRCTDDPPQIIDGKIWTWPADREHFLQHYECETVAEVRDESGEVTGYTLADIDKLGKGDLKKLATEVGIDATGMRKSDLISAILNLNNPPADDPTDDE